MYTPNQHGYYPIQLIEQGIRPNDVNKIKFIEDHPKVAFIRKQKIEHILFFAFNDEKRTYSLFHTTSNQQSSVYWTKDDITFALESSCGGKLIAVHNHPKIHRKFLFFTTASDYPSVDDIIAFRATARQLKQEGSLLLDSLIVADKKTISMKKLGYIV